MSLYGELKRRNVFRVAAAYIVMGWLLLQVADVAFEFISAPDWAGKLLITLLVLGFPPAIAVAWVFEFTPEGLKRDPDSENGREENHVAARRLDIITLFAVVVLAFWTFYEQMTGPVSETQPVAETTEAAEGAAKPEPARTQAAAPAGRTTQRFEVEPLALDGLAVAVLPFTNRSAEPDTAYFVDGIHDDLLTQLAKIAELKVISRTSVLEYRDTTKNMRQIGEELGAGNILEGAVQRAGNRVRINAQLIDANTDKHLWADSFDRELTADNLFDIQADIARNIAKAMASTLSLADLEAIGAERSPTRNQAAYDAYLRARSLGSELSADDARDRIELLKTAVELDPNFTLAVAEIGHQYTNWYWFGTKRTEHRDEGRKWLQRAREMDPEDPLIQWMWADHLYHGHLDYEGALAALSEAEQGLPNGADIYKLRSWILRRQGRFEEAIASMQRAIQLDPRDPVAIAELSFSYGAIHELDDARIWHRRLLSLGSDDPETRLLPLLVESYLGADTQPMRSYIESLASEDRLIAPQLHYERAQVAYLDRDYAAALGALDQWPEDPVVMQNLIMSADLFRAFVAAAQGDDSADRYARQAADQFNDFLASHPEDARGFMARAFAHALSGDREAALADAEQGVQRYSLELDRLAGAEFLSDQVRVKALVLDSAPLAREVERLINLKGAVMGFDGLMLDPVFDRHRDHPSFQALAERYSPRPL